MVRRHRDDYDCLIPSAILCLSLVLKPRDIRDSHDFMRFDTLNISVYYDTCCFSKKCKIVNENEKPIY